MLRHTLPAPIAMSSVTSAISRSPCRLRDAVDLTERFAQVGVRDDADELLVAIDDGRFRVALPDAVLLRRRERVARPERVGGLEDRRELLAARHLQQREAADGAAQAARPVEHVDARLGDLLAARDAVARFARPCSRRAASARAARPKRRRCSSDSSSSSLNAMSHCGPSELSTASRCSLGKCRSTATDSWLPSRSSSSARVGRRLPLDALRGAGRQHVADDGRRRRHVDGVQHGVRLLGGHRLEEARGALGMQAQIGGDELLAAAHGVFLILTNGSALKCCPGTETSPRSVSMNTQPSAISTMRPSNAPIFT